MSGIVGASSSRSALKIKSRVTIDTIENCQHVLKVSKNQKLEMCGKNTTGD